MHCRHCGVAVPGDAKFCPGCGAAVGATAGKAAKATTTPKIGGCGALILIVLGLAFLGSVFGGKSDAEKAVDQTAAAEDKEKGFHCLSKWDGSHRGLVDQVKANLRDPKSFEHDETRIAPNKNGKHNLVMTYRARKGFGGMNVGTVIATVDHASCTATILSMTS